MASSLGEAIMKAAKANNKEWITFGSQQYMLTNLGSDTPFSKIDPSWMANVRPHHYSTIVRKSDNSYQTLLINLHMQRWHCVTVAQASIIEKQTGQEVMRRKQASSQSNRLVVSTQPLRLRCVIPECLYLSMNGQSSLDSVNHSVASLGTSNASDVFSQTSHRVLESISSGILRTMPDVTLYSKLHALDETWKGFTAAGSEDSELVKCSAILKYGAEAVEQMALMFILTQSKMRMRLDVEKMKVVQSEHRRAKRDEEKARKRAARVEEVDDVDIKPKKEILISSLLEPSIKYATPLGLPPPKKRRKTQYTNDEQDVICIQYFNASTDVKKQIREAHNLEVHTLGNWRRRAEKAADNNEKEQIPKLESSINK